MHSRIRERVRAGPLVGALLAAVILTLSCGCGDPPVGMPPLQAGSLHVVAMDTLAVDSIDVGLDEVALGRRKNPTLLEGVVAGTHLLSVRDRSGFGQDTMVLVADNVLSLVLLRIQTEGAYVGSIAPPFRATSVTGDTIDLVKSRGKVVLLVFFEHT